VTRRSAGPAPASPGTLRTLPLENVEIEERRAVDHADDDHLEPCDPEDRPVRCVDEMPVLDAEVQRFGNDRTPPRPLLEAFDASLKVLDPSRGSGGIVPRDVRVDRLQIALRRPGDVNAVSSRHGERP
jgi:hypothetical protein